MDELTDGDDRGDQVEVEIDDLGVVVGAAADLAEAVHPRVRPFYHPPFADLQPNTLSTLVQALGVPSIAARTAAIRQHVLDLPAPIVATTLGYHQVTTARLTAEAGTTWASYAPLRAP